MAAKEKGPALNPDPTPTPSPASTTSTTSVSAKRPQQAGLFPGSTEAPVVRPLVLMTSGRRETAVHCPSCSSWHRHVGLGPRRAPCGVVYRIQSRNATTRSTT